MAIGDPVPNFNSACNCQQTSQPFSWSGACVSPESLTAEDVRRIVREELNNVEVEADESEVRNIIREEIRRAMSALSRAITRI